MHTTRQHKQKKEVEKTTSLCFVMVVFVLILSEEFVVDTLLRVELVVILSEEFVADTLLRVVFVVIPSEEPGSVYDLEGLGFGEQERISLDYPDKLVFLQPTVPLVVGSEVSLEVSLGIDSLFSLLV